MNTLDFELAFGQALNLDVAQIFTALFLALVLGVLVALVYRSSIRHRVVSHTLQSSFVLLSLVSSMVMMVIGNNLARAFSLAGALAIIRFRTRLKSPWDITFVFLSLAVGIATGVFAFRVAIVGTVVVCLAVFALQVLPLGGRGEVHFLRCDLAAYEGKEASIAAVLERHLSQRWLVEARSLRFGETLSYRYRVVMKNEDGLEAFLRELSNVEGVERIVLDKEEERSE
jgi:NAD(P)-dependent dehydrogenase (short-subunit alcohol dehydrogenase family)